MEEREVSVARPRDYWLISRRETGRAEVLTVEVDGEETLAVFSFEEEALLFLLFEDPGSGWRVGRIFAGEMVGMLLGPLAARAGRVSLDPLPTILAEGTNRLVSLEREDFARRLSAEQG